MIESKRIIQIITSHLKQGQVMTSDFCSFSSTTVTSDSGVRSRKRTGISESLGFFFSRNRIQEAKESLEEVPVMHMASTVPSSCSWTLGGITIDFGLSSSNNDH